MADPAAFDRPELGALWTELRRRFEAAGESEVRTVRLARLGPAERSALADLLGLARLPGEPATVAVARVDEAVRRGWGLGVRELTERLHGPLRDRPAERAAAAAERAELWADLDAHPLVTALPALRGWVDGMRRGGLIGGSVAATAAHCRAVLRAAPELPGVPTVHVVENPSLLAMAVHRFGPACPPLVCTAGWPNTAAVLLLRRLRDAGAALHYHGDFDGEGLRIAA